MSKSFFDIPQYRNDTASALEKDNIKELMTYERYCRDNGRFDDMKACYSDDSRVRISCRPEIVEALYEDVSLWLYS